MDRPKCESCPAFVRGPDKTGTCRHDPPVIVTVYRVVTPTQMAEGDEPAPRKTSGPWGRWPAVNADSACCSRHPVFPAYAKSSALGRPLKSEVEPDDDFNF